MNAEVPLRKSVSMHEAKTHLSRLVARVEAGEEIIVKRGTKEVAKLVPLTPSKRPDRVPGRLAHQKPPGSKSITDNGFWDPLSDEEMGLVDNDHDPLSPNYRP